MALRALGYGASESVPEDDKEKPLETVVQTPPLRRTSTGAPRMSFDGDYSYDGAVLGRIYSWFVMCQHPRAAYRWMSGMYMLFSVRVCLAAVYSEKMEALPTSYNVLVPVCWLLVLHVLFPLCLLAKDHVHEGISALARAKIQGRADLDEDMCFRDPKMQEKLWRHGQASRGSQELAGVAFQLVGMFKLAKDCGGVTPGGAFDPISTQEVLLLHLPSLALMMIRFMIPRRSYTAKVAEAVSYLQTAAIPLVMRAAVRSSVINGFSDSVATCISNYFSFALMTEIFWFKTERVRSWKVPAARMALPVIMLVHAMFERWELRNGFAGFGPPATPEMLVIGLHVLPAVCAGILSSLLATYIQASRVKSFLAAQGTRQ